MWIRKVEIRIQLQSQRSPGRRERIIGGELVYVSRETQRRAIKMRVLVDTRG